VAAIDLNDELLWTWADGQMLERFFFHLSPAFTVSYISLFAGLNSAHCRCSRRLPRARETRETGLTTMDPIDITHLKDQAPDSASSVNRKLHCQAKSASRWCA
jgi:hypothetical protein